MRLVSFLVLLSVMLVVLACRAEPESTPTTTAPTPTATWIPTPTPTATPTITPTPSPTPTPTATPTPTPIPTPTPVPTWPVSETSGDWYVGTDEIDVLTDKRKVMMAHSILTLLEGDPVLVVRCNVDSNKPNIPEVLIAWQTEIESSLPTVTWRLDDQPVQSAIWIASSSGELTFYPHSDQDFIWSLMHADMLVARIQENQIITATFELEGLAEALRPFKDSCDWVGF